MREKRCWEEPSPQDKPSKYLPLADVCMLVTECQSLGGGLVALRMGPPKLGSNLKGTDSI